jgi:hypothetical protein
MKVWKMFLDRNDDRVGGVSKMNVRTAEVADHIS